jgi:hypothetical protein
MCRIRARRVQVRWVRTRRQEEDMADRLVLPDVGTPVTPRTTRDVIGDALSAGARTVVIPVERLDAAYFDLRTGVAGDIVQAFVNYQLRLVVLGPLPPAATASSSFGAFVEEANRGTQIWFVPTAEALEERLRERG